MLLFASCGGDKRQENLKFGDMDLTISPAEDFYKYANGNWIANTKMPDDKSRYSVFDIINDLNQQQLRELFENLSSEKQPEGSNAEKIAMFYNSGMDTIGINKAGVEPIRFLLDTINNIQNLNDLQDVIALLQFYGVSVPFGADCEIDSKNSTMNVLTISQDGLGLPTRDYYLDDDSYFVDIRTAYQQHIFNIFKLLGQDSVTARESADCVYKIEYELAQISMDKEQMRDPFITYNKMGVNQLSELTGCINWNRFFEKLTIPAPKFVIVCQTDFMLNLDKILRQTSITDWKTYITWHVVSNCAEFLSADFENENFDFYGRILSGKMQQQLRWKRILSTTSYMLDDAVGQLYVEKYFSPQAKQRALSMLTNMRTALAERLNNLTWMSDTTKVKAQEKLAAINVKVGYPNKWYDFSGFKPCDSYAKNILNLLKYKNERDIKNVDKPVDKERWYMSPQTVNAYYMPTMNEIVFPAAILQPPFFFANGDDAINYGAIGVVMGHEITHGFDDEGRNYDKDGNISEWWTPEDAEKFKARAQTLINRFNSFVVIDTMHANGTYTLGENIADLGGLNIAYTAFSKTEQWKNQNAKIDGFTPDQRFFIAYAQVWCQLIRDEAIRQRTQTDPHALGCYRVEGPLPSIDAFVKAFDVKPGDRYYLPDSLKTVIW